MLGARANGRSSESYPSSLGDGRVVSDEGEANKRQYQIWCVHHAKWIYCWY
ncbi:MAG: hypothetical protein J6T43_05860 [Prevotella sp.]|nr:hypothetical protein [Prevotella sp.]